MPESSLWYTNPPDSSEIKYRLAKQREIEWQNSIPPEGLIIKVDPGKRFQEILGIGTSLEATSLYAIRKGKT